MPRSSKAEAAAPELILERLRKSGKLFVRPCNIEALTDVSPDFYERVSRRDLPRVEYSRKLVLYAVDDLIAFWSKYLVRQ